MKYYLGMPSSYFAYKIISQIMEIFFFQSALGQIQSDFSRHQSHIFLLQYPLKLQLGSSPVLFYQCKTTGRFYSQLYSKTSNLFSTQPFFLIRVLGAVLNKSIRPVIGSLGNWVVLEFAAREQCVLPLSTLAPRSLIHPLVPVGRGSRGFRAYYMQTYLRCF